MPDAISISHFQFTPRPITDRKYWGQIERDPNVAVLLDRLREVGDAIPDRPFHNTATEYLAARRSNDRGVVDRYWQNTRGKLSHLVIEQCIAGDTATGSGDVLLDWLWAFLTAPTWVVSAHLPRNDLPLTHAPQLDLAACEMAANLAETLEVLKPWVDNQSQTLADSIVYEIDRRVLTPFTEGTTAHWYDPAADHFNNWVGVCAGSILAACESLAVLGHSRPAARAKAIGALNDLFLGKAFTPAGECDEGVGYWSYGIAFACLGWSRLSKSDFLALVDHPRLATVADYPRRVHLFDNYFYSGNDASLTANAPVFCTAWLAGATGSSWLAEWSRSGASRGDVRLVSATLRSIDAALRFPSRRPAFPTPEDARFLTDQQALIVRHGPITLALAGGHNEEAHNHNDVGHFCLWHDRSLVIPDLGAPHYTTDFFRAETRYNYLSASSRGHCCPVINGVEQRVGRSAAAHVLHLDPSNQVMTLDCTAAYPSKAELTKWVRSLSRPGESFELADTFITANDGTVENVYWSLQHPSTQDGEISLGPVRLRIEPPGEVSVEAVDPTPHRLREFAQTLYRVTVRYSTRNNTPLTIKTTIGAAP